MPKLPAVSADDAIRAFGNLGYEIQRQSSSHVVLAKAGERFVLTVPKHGNRDLKPGTLRSLIRTANISVERFIELLG